MFMCRHAFAVGLFILVGCLQDSVGVAQPRAAQVHKISARQLITAYAKNEVAAGKKYGDRNDPQEIEVQGVVHKVQAGKFGPIVLLEGDHGMRVAISLRDDDQQHVKSGQTIIVRGKCKGLLEKDKTIDIVNGVLVREKQKE
jgi:hypothetical protein